MRTGVETRQVFDLPERLIEVTEHQAAIYACAIAAARTRARFPAGVSAPAQYGARFRAAAVYLNVQQLIPEDRVAQTMADLFGAARFCPTSLAQWMAAQGAGVRTGARPASPRWRRPRRCAASTRPAFASPAETIGCTRSPPKP